MAQEQILMDLHLDFDINIAWSEVEQILQMYIVHYTNVVVCIE